MHTTLQQRTKSDGYHRLPSAPETVEDTSKDFGGGGEKERERNKWTDRHKHTKKDREK